MPSSVLHGRQAHLWCINIHAHKNPKHINSVLTFLDLLYYFMCVSLLPACIYLYHMYAWCLLRSKRCWVPWDVSDRWLCDTMWVHLSNPDSLQEQVFSTAESSLQPQHKNNFSTKTNLFLNNCEDFFFNF